ncbi:MAG: hypothetical protein FJ144_08910 [Deltaproteobacteria bacterium]|nr:hypothetical protein [Deltaproteobacteria bacterium]
MARLNISIPSDLYPLAVKWRRRVNLSEICSRALREELEAAEQQRSANALFEALRPPADADRELAEALGLREARVLDDVPRREDLRESLGRLAASYLERTLGDGSLLAIAGGRQMWCLVRNLRPRPLAVTVTALGVHQNDPRVLHAHANTLTTLLWLLFSPHAEAHLVGAEAVSSVWRTDLPKADYPRYFVVGSCAQFDPTGSFGSLIGAERSDALRRSGATGDFLYQFFGESGELLDEAPFAGRDHSVLPRSLLAELSAREDARVILVGGGKEKRDVVRHAVAARLCNTLVTDPATAEFLRTEAREAK